MRYVPRVPLLPVLVVIASIVLVSSPVMASSKHNHRKTHKVSAPAVSAIAGTLIFVSNRTGAYELYEKNLASNQITALTTGPFDSMNPEVSPDGTELVFYSDRSGSNQIYELNLQTPSKVTQLTLDTNGVSNYDPTFTFDGNNILFKKTDTSGGYGDIWEMNTNGGNQQDLTPTLTANKIEAWKPVQVSSTQVVFTERAEPGVAASDNLFSLNTVSGVITQLTNYVSSSWFPDYSPLTGKVVFITKQQARGDDVLETINPNGTGKQLLVSKSGDNDDPAWSVDGQHVVFINNDTGDYDIYAANANGSGITLLDQSPHGTKDLSPLLLP